ncbi:MAG: hypothetical protein LBS99_06140, partial [Clostridiales bacterium]|nr:hypothetical protein [Clostridiales bacterium]
IDTNDRIEAAGADFFDKVYNGFLLAAREYAERIVIVEAGGTKFETQDKIRGILRERKIIC